MPWDTPTRVQYKTLLQTGYSGRHAAELLGISESTDRTFLKKPDRVRKPPGAPPKIPEQKIREIIRWFTGYYDRRISSLKKIREQFNLNCCDNTLLAVFVRRGYYYHSSDYKPFISKQNRLKQ